MTDGIIAYFSSMTIVNRGFREELLFLPHEHDPQGIVGFVLTIYN